MPRKKTASFEENLQELEKIVSRLEGGEAPSEEIMADYATGMELSGKCLEAPKKGEERMDILLAENGDGSVMEQELIIDNK